VNAYRRRRAKPRTGTPGPRNQDGGSGSSPAGASEKYDLSDEEREWVARTIARIGPLTRQDREFLILMLRKPG
jgi:hypothetical protein